jgi:hypothetical protein
MHTIIQKAILPDCEMSVCHNPYIPDVDNQSDGASLIVGWHLLYLGPEPFIYMHPSTGLIEELITTSRKSRLSLVSLITDNRFVEETKPTGGQRCTS